MRLTRQTRTLVFALFETYAVVVQQYADVFPVGDCCL